MLAKEKLSGLNGFWAQSAGFQAIPHPVGGSLVKGCLLGSVGVGFRPAFFQIFPFGAMKAGGGGGWKSKGEIKDVVCLVSKEASPLPNSNPHQPAFASFTDLRNTLQKFNSTV